MFRAGEPAQHQGEHRQVQGEGEGLRREVVLTDPVADAEQPDAGPDQPAVLGERAVDQHQRGQHQDAGEQRPPAHQGEGVLHPGEAHDGGLGGEEAGPLVVHGHVAEFRPGPQAAVGQQVADDGVVLPRPGVQRRRVHEGLGGTLHDQQAEHVRQTPGVGPVGAADGEPEPGGEHREPRPVGRVHGADQAEVVQFRHVGGPHGVRPQGERDGQGADGPHGAPAAARGGAGAGAAGGAPDPGLRGPGVRAAGCGGVRRACVAPGAAVACGASAPSVASVTSVALGARHGCPARRHCRSHGPPGGCRRCGFCRMVLVGTAHHGATRPGAVPVGRPRAVPSRSGGGLRRSGPPVRRAPTGPAPDAASPRRSRPGRGEPPPVPPGYGEPSPVPPRVRRAFACPALRCGELPPVPPRVRQALACPAPGYGEPPPVSPRVGRAPTGPAPGAARPRRSGLRYFNRRPFPAGVRAARAARGPVVGRGGGHRGG